MKKKIAYVAMAVDFLHEGHLNVLNKAASLGDVIVGLLTDEAVVSYKKFLHLSYKERKKLIKNFSFIKNIIPQNTLDYTKNLQKIKPDFVVHGDDWKLGSQNLVRKKVILTLKKWKGKLVEVKYTKNISLQKIKKKFLEIGSNPIYRVEKLKRLLESKKLVRIMECHNPLSGLIVENTFSKKDSGLIEYDAMWSSSLTDSVSRAKPDNQSVDYSTRIQGANAILAATTKPMLFDIDNGGHIEHLIFILKDLERVGVSGVVIEDKIGLKKNSLFENQNNVKQDSISNFCKKIQIAKNKIQNKDFLIIARIESLILGKPIKDAIKRAESYSRAGADAILIHSKQKNPHEIFEFAKIFKKSNFFKPMIAIPSTYSKTYEKDLIKNGFKVVIYANQLLRASYRSMHEVAKKILVHQRSFEVEKNITPIKDIISLIS
jgi:phosphoenolpyruvate phosphomutase